MHWQDKPTGKIRSTHDVDRHLRCFSLSPLVPGHGSRLILILLDFNNPMPSGTDQLFKLSNTICLSAIMCNVTPFLGTMDEHEIFVNLTVLGVLEELYNRETGRVCYKALDYGQKREPPIRDGPFCDVFYCWIDLFLDRAYFGQGRATVIIEEHNTEVDISHYVVRLEGERKLPKRILKNISDVENRVIQNAKKHQPANGIVNFDSDQVEHLHSQEPSNCWSLVVVILTSIAITLPSIAQDATNRLLSNVKEGLSYIRLIGKSLDTKGDLVNAKKAADYVWLGVELYCLWLNNDLQKIKKTRTYKATLQILVDIARATVLEFKRNAHGSSDEEPTGPYRSWLQIPSDILGACLTNLPRVITMYCYYSTTENREENVRLAANLLGETEVILKVIQWHETQEVSLDQVVYIDEWRACLKERSSQFFSCSSESNEIFYPANSGEFRILLFVEDHLKEQGVSFIAQ
ncbi:hypothetical protein LguiA_015485 [Lonicera macranthoides]